MKPFGIIILIVGITLGIYALSMDTSVEVDYYGYSSYKLPKRVNNLGLMNKQRNLLIVSGILSLTGLIIIITSMSIKTNNNEKEILETQKTQQKVQDTNSQQNISSIADNLKKIKELLDSGVINQEEYKKIKIKLLDSIENSTSSYIKPIKINVNDAVNNSNYKTPEIKSQKKFIEKTFLSSNERFDIEFIDGLEGSIFHKQNKKEFFIKDKSQYDWVTVKHYYEDFNYCINALHYYLKTGKRLDEGYIISHS